MSCIVALDASAESCSVALTVDGEAIFSLFSDQPRAHASHLLPFVNELLQKAGITLAELDAIACAIGPGSFTGLRIALSVAQGLAYATDKPVIGVNSLAAMVEDYKLRHPDAAYDLYLPLLDARMSEVYWAKVAQPLLSSPQALLGTQDDFAPAVSEAIEGKDVMLLGAAWHSVNYAAALIDESSLPLDKGAATNAEAVLSLAQAAFLRGEAQSAAEVDLCYCRDSIAWNKRVPIRAR